jgi:hypothetical protein
MPPGLSPNLCAPAAPPREHAWPTARFWGVTAGLLAVLGVALRSVHFGRNPAMWHDEAALVLNVIQKGFMALLGPLLHAEAAPPLFLWIERAMVLMLGDGTYALRLVPYLASFAMVVLIWIAARRWLEPEAAAWAVLLLACSERLLWHACEAKPYAVDALLGLAIISLYEYSLGWPLNRRLLVFAALAPVAVWLSFPGCFLFGGVLLVSLNDVRHRKHASTWACYGLLALLVLGSFTALYLGPIHAQRNVAMDSCWVRTFPDWHRPWLIPWWFVVSTVEVVDYCLRPLGGVLVGVALVGGIRLWRDNRRHLVGLIIIPMLLAAAAALMHAYPYTGARVMVYALPGIVLLTAAGVRPILAWIAASGRPWSRWGFPLARLLQALVLLPLLAPMGLSLYRTAVPWARADTAGASAYVLAQRQPEDAVVAGHWEYDYYFRRLGTAYHPLDQWPQLKLSEVRLWLVITAHSAPERDALIEALRQPQWQVARRRDFVHTTAVLLIRNDHSSQGIPRTQQRPYQISQGPAKNPVP